MFFDIFSMFFKPFFFGLLDKVHKHEIQVDTEAVLAEIWDTCMVNNLILFLIKG